MRLRKSKVAKKGIEPVINISIISTIVILLCRRLDINLDESQAQLITGGVITLGYGILRAFRNWWKHR